MGEWLPGMLQPDAGRLERVARRYAIACLASPAMDAIDAIVEATSSLAALDAYAPVIDTYYQTLEEAADSPHACAVWRLLRARVALYLRWCERVERHERWGVADARGRGMGSAWDGIPSVYLEIGWRWAVPLWTMAPAHDPAVTPKTRRSAQANGADE